MNKRIKIIIAEDDPDEQIFLREGFEKSGLFEIIQIFSNGYQLITELERLSADTLPDIILSDINMPLMTGTEALTKVKSNPMLAIIPFIIFTSSKEHNTREICYSLGADNFLIKPPTFDYDLFIIKLQKIYTNWFLTERGNK